MRFDLLLAGGTVIDPLLGIEERRDVAFAHGVVAAMEEKLPPSEAVNVVRCDGSYVVPGLIDLHVHAYSRVSHYGIDPDRHLLRRGVCTAIDAGSAGADTYAGLREFIIRPARTRLFSFLNISSIGLLSPTVGELEDLRYANVDKAVAVAEANRDTIRGIKVRLTEKFVGASAGIEPLVLARNAARRAGIPLMVHPQDAGVDSIDPILELLKPGDILTHTLHGHRCGIIDPAGRVRSSVLEAKEHGIVFDTGHGRGSFSWKIAERAAECGFFPQTISTDLHAYNIGGPVYDLLTTIEKFLYLGLPLAGAIDKVTRTPAAVIGESGHLGTLAPAASGDALVFNLEQEAVELRDSEGAVRIGSRRLNPKLIVRSGIVIEPEHGGS